MNRSWRAALQPRYLPSTVLLALETVLIAGALVTMTVYNQNAVSYVGSAGGLSTYFRVVRL